MDKEEFLKRYQNGERDFSGIELRDMDLSFITLAKVSFHRAKLINVNFQTANLKNADFSEADLTGSYLVGADLIEANLTKANLSNSNLYIANLTEAKLNNSILTNTDLNCTELIGADLTGSNIEEAINVSSTHLLLVDEDKSNNTELVTVIRNLTRGLANYYNSEDAYPYNIFLWNKASRGNFTLEKFLEAAGFLVKVDSIDFLDYTFPVEEFSFILQEIKPFSIKNREYYYFKFTTRLFNDEKIPVLIGNTETGDWIGICPLFDIGRGFKKEIGRITDKASNKIEYLWFFST